MIRQSGMAKYLMFLLIIVKLVINYFFSHKTVPAYYNIIKSLLIDVLGFNKLKPVAEWQHVNFAEISGCPDIVFLNSWLAELVTRFHIQKQTDFRRIYFR